MFDWLRRRKRYETYEEAQAAVLRKVMRLNAPPPTADMTAVSAPFAIDIGPSDGCAHHHSGSSHCDVAPSCDGGGFSLH